MSDDLNKKIKQITDILGQEKMPDNLKELLTMLTGSGSNDNAVLTRDESSKDSQVSPIKEEKTSKNDLEDNLDMIRKAKKMMDKVTSHNDPRTNLLMAIKPFLNSTRQKRVNNCVKMLNMSQLTKLMEDND
jgi:hypothetical protein